MSARSRLLAVGGGAVIALFFAHGCGSEDDGEGNDAGVAAAGGSGGAGASGAAGGAGGVGGSGGSVGGAAGSGATGGAAGCSPSSQLPPGVPDGWKEWTKYSCACRLYVPEGGAAVLPAVQWEPCPQGVFGNPTCRRVKTDWTQTSASSLSGFAQFWFDAGVDKAYLQLSRIHHGDNPNVRFKTVEEVDGVVRNVFLQVNPYNEGCEALTHHLGDGHFAFGMMGDSWTGPMLGTREGVIAGPIGTEDPVVIKQDMPPQSTSHWWVSQKWLFERRIETHAHSWDQSETVTVHDPGTDPEAMPSHGLVGVGDSAFFEVGVAGYRGVMSWTKTAGTQPLLRWLGDWTQGAGNFNTDGVHMVWTHGEGKTDKSSQEYPVRSVKTAPFTTDPAVAQATQKRLRSDPAQLGTEPYGIGCGYAGRGFDAGDGPSIATHLLIVRLSDGVSWTISAPPASQGVLLGNVMGFTCEELFATAQFPDDGMTIVRIRLASLGPGTPPD